MTQVTINVSYSQLAAFDPKLKKPFNDWTDRHVRQGFAWRPGSVSFRTLQDGTCLVDVLVRNKAQVSRGARRAILVPFDVSKSNSVEIGSISDSVEIELPQGEYSLLFETGFDRAKEAWCNLVFIQPAEKSARLLLADSELDPKSPLLMKAEAA